MSRSTGGSKGNRDRGQSELIGVILVFGLMIVGAVVVVALGASAVGDSQDRLSEQRAEKAMTQFDSKAALVALGSSDVQQVSFGAERASNFEVQNGQGWMKISKENLTDGNTTTLVNQSLGAITYEVNDNTIAYQGGGVWKTAGTNESVMVSPPEFHFREGTLTLPVINVTGEPSLGSRSSVTHEETTREYPNAGDVNPLDNDLIKVTVKSDYYRGWGRYFEDRTEGSVEYNHGRDIVNLTLVTPIDVRKITAATASLSASGSFEIQGSAKSLCSDDEDVENPGGNDEMYTNSYNSSESGDYCDQADGGGYGHRGDIVYGEDVNISYGSGGSWIHGDVVSGGNVLVSDSGGSGQTSVYGHINHTGACNPHPGDCEDRIKSGDSRNKIDGISKADQINWYVENTVDNIDSGGALIDASNRLDFDAEGPDDEIELDSGRYLVNAINPDSDDKIILNTSDGNIRVGVRGDVTLPEDATIEVKGDGNVQMYVANRSIHKTNSRWALKMNKESGVLTPDDRADQFRLYGKDSMDARIGDGGGGASGQAKFVGVIYAPPGQSGGTGTVKLDKGEVLGGILTGTTIIENGGGSIHFDEKLANTQIVDPDARTISITYLHISVNEIRVS